MEHKPVLLNQVIEVLAPKEGEVFIDLTAGYGGHATSLLDHVGKSGRGYLYDQDKTAVTHLKKKFSGKTNILVSQANFNQVDWSKIGSVDIILADLGVSSPQLDNPKRGFSFRTDAPLDMRMNQQMELMAADIVNNYSEKDLTNLLYAYGEEHRARKIAHLIVQTRQQHPITTTVQLAELVRSVVPKYSKLDPATKTFQALRIATNNELDVLRQMLPEASQALASEGRLAVIAFHSLEDRIVKQFFRTLCTPIQNEYGQIITPASFQPVTKKAIKGDQFDNNPRARSARLRAVVKQT